MNKTTRLRSVWAVADDYCIEAMKSDNKESSGVDIKDIDIKIHRNKDNDDESPSVSKSRHETPSNIVPFQNHGFFSVYEPKNNLNTETAEDFDAIPEEFRPKLNVKDTSTKNYSDEYNSMKYIKKYDNTQTSGRENVSQTPDIKETAPKGVTWNENLKTDFSVIGQQFRPEAQNSKYDSKAVEQRRGNYVRNDYIGNKSFSEDRIRNNQMMSGKNNKDPAHSGFRHMPNRTNPEHSASNGDKMNKKQSPSMTILSQITKLHVITPDREIETRKTVQTSWTTNGSKGREKNKSGNMSDPGEALFEHISRKPSGRKKMTWMEDLCTVNGNDEDGKNTFEYVYRSSDRCSPAEQAKVQQQRKNMNYSSFNKSHFDKKKDVSNEVRHARNSFNDHAEEFIRAQYRYKAERGGRKVERINLPNRQSTEEVPVVKHIVEVIHVNQPILRSRGRGRSVFRGRTRGRGYYANQRNGSQFAPGNKQQFENNTKSENFDFEDWKEMDTKATDKANEVNKNESVLYQFSSRSTENDQRFVKNQSRINVVENRGSGVFSQSKGTGRGYSVYSESCTTRFESPSRELDSKDIQNKRSILIHFGNEISDTVVGSFTAMNMFLSFYEEWKNLRIKAMTLLESIVGNISNTNNRRTKTLDILQIFGNGGRMVAAIPDYRVALAGRIVAVLSEFFAKLFGSSPTLKQSGMNEFELMLCLQQDIDATSDMNIFGLQCDQNFQETGKLIEEFHNTIQGWCFKDIAEGVDVDFLEDISAMNPKHHIVYYRRLQKWLERLADNSSTDIGRAFTRGFKDFPDALKITNLLHWRFHAQGIDETVNLRSWEEIRELLQNGDSVAVVDILKKIQNSLLVLIKERSAMEKDVMELLNTEKTKMD